MKNLSVSILSAVALLVLAVAVSSCAASTDEANDVDQFADSPENIQVNAITYGTWVNMGVDFGPCGVLPSTCVVGDQVSAHSGPGTAGGCYTYQCN